MAAPKAPEESSGKKKETVIVLDDPDEEREPEDEATKADKILAEQNRAIESQSVDEIVASISLVTNPYAQDVPDPEYSSLTDLPALPAAQTERSFYAQWQGRNIVRDLPLAGNTPWLRAWNLGDGNCYWRAISHILYGRDIYWPWVKTQHRIWYYSVLGDSNHVRHDLYQELNEGTVKDGMSIHYRLNVRDAWASEHILQITADLYDIYLVVFSLGTSPNIRTTILARGCRNSPHRFICHVNGNHYEPIRPLVPRPSEYHHGELTNESRELWNGRTNKTKRPPVCCGYRCSGKKHSTEIVPEQILPRPVIPLPSEEDLALTLGIDPPPEGFSKTPGYDPEALRMAAKKQWKIQNYKRWTNDELAAEIKNRGLTFKSKMKKDERIELLVNDDITKDAAKATVKKPQSANVAPNTGPGGLSDPATTTAAPRPDYRNMTLDELRQAYFEQFGTQPLPNSSPNTLRLQLSNAAGAPRKTTPPKELNGGSGKRARPGDGDANEEEEKEENDDKTKKPKKSKK